MSGGRRALRLLLLLAHLTPVVAARAQDPGAVPVIVDEQGVMRWSGTGAEVALFGVNYTLPFAYAYRAHGYVGAGRKAAIDADVAHLARLGVDAYRVHVWDREISDREGNVLANDHLDLLDYLIAKLEEREIKIILTPIFWGGAGYPERDPRTPGFSNDYSKGAMTTDSAARRVQRRYLQEFVGHLNPYTGRTYRDDAGIIGIELFNEPSHPAPPAEQTRYIDDLAAAVRETGYRKPIFYNISIGWSDAHAKAVCSARIQGVTFQWYPSGLVRGSTVQANLLPNVDRYPIPFIDTPECRGKARLVYEFDAADAGGSYLYPAMARTFRGAGMQWATQFAYDPLAIAHANTEYQTHYLNLVYTPQKALSFLIAGEAFRRLPRGGSQASYPESTRFGPFRVSYPEDLSEVAADSIFYHSNSTPTAPLDLSALRHVAGWGESPVVGYEGAGAYFLDRLEDGVWRLEVYPDAVQVKDPFGRPSLSSEATRLLYREWPMRISLPDLGDGFIIGGLNAGNTHASSASAGSFRVTPGVYLLRRAGLSGARWGDPATRVGKLLLGELHLPPRADQGTTVVHRPALAVDAARPLAIRARVAAPETPVRVELWWRTAPSLEFNRTEMRRVRGIEYEGVVPAGSVNAGVLEYAVRVEQGGRIGTHPGGRTGGLPGDTLWRVTVAAPDEPIVLFDVQRDAQRILYPHPYRYVRFRTETVDGSAPMRRALRVDVESFEPDPHHFAVRSFVGEEGRPRLASAGAGGVLKVRARSTGPAAERMEVAVVQEDGSAWGAVISLSTEWRDVEVPLASLRPTTLALLPRPYPEFLPNELTLPPATARTVEMARVEGIQLRIGAELFDASEPARAHGFEVERITIERSR